MENHQGISVMQKYLNLFVFLVFSIFSVGAQVFDENWTDEEFQEYVDSLCARLYAPVYLQTADSTQLQPTRPEIVATSFSDPIENRHVPKGIKIDKDKAVGEIKINSGTTKSGAKTYDVPLEIYPGVNGFQPKLALSYNSQQGNSVVGYGWNIGGLSSISRGGNDLYHDGKVQSVTLTNDDSFILDGVKLIKISTAGDYFVYESETGNVKAKAYFAENVLKYFEVFYPNGEKGIYGFTSNADNKLYYPLTSLTDLFGNKITYDYNDNYNHYRISSVSYNGAFVRFKYSTRKDELLSFCAGLKVSESGILSEIICSFNGKTISTYTLEHDYQNSATILKKIHYRAGESSYNPLVFYYGEGKGSAVYEKSTTQLNEWYISNDPKMIKATKGRFDYDAGCEGLIVLPNQNPYIKIKRSGSVFSHSQNRFVSNYKGDEKILLYTGLNEDWASPMPNLLTEKGFVDILCADLVGLQEEYVIKINNYVENDYDQVVFTVYRSNTYSGLEKLYTRTFKFPTMFKDADGGKSIQPKFYYSGDFNGDGKMEILAVSAHKPFGNTLHPSNCYLFDLQNNKILYQGEVFSYNVEFVGSGQEDANVAADKSDKLLIMDYDGDGKTDICHIDNSNLTFYTFENTGGVLKPKKAATSNAFSNSKLAGRDILVGEFNGDGLMDILVSPVDGENNWNIYNSKGDGNFYVSFFTGATYSTADFNGIFVQDVDNDGKTDLIKYEKDGFRTFPVEHNEVSSSLPITLYPNTGSILVPTNINSRNKSVQLTSIYEGIVTKYSYLRNNSKELLATGMSNSLGVMEKNRYQYINEEGVADGFYKKGYDAVYPYVNIQEPIAVIAATDIYVNNERVDNRYYKYENAVFHRQGLGFCGFGKVSTFNKRGHETYQTYDPYNYSILTRDVSPSYDKKYNYKVNVKTNKLAEIRLTSKTETDLLKGISATSSYTYDDYGYPLEESTGYTGGIAVTKTNTYKHKADLSGEYYLGFITNQHISTRNSRGTCNEGIYIPGYIHNRPIVTVYSKRVSPENGSTVKEEYSNYDSHGNVVISYLMNYNSQNKQTSTYEYDSFCRLTKITDPLGLTEEYEYDQSGRVYIAKDSRGLQTKVYYDDFGRETRKVNPDSTEKTVTYSWSGEKEPGLYAITETETGKPTVTTYYDDLNREVRSSELRFDGNRKNIDRSYDTYGNLEKVSLPFFGNTPKYWNTYYYDHNDRVMLYVEAGGKRIDYAYIGNSITTTENGRATTKTYDALDNLISVEDINGTVSYELNADGQIATATTPDNVVTTITYDSYGRQISLDDPSHGCVRYTYDKEGNIASTTNANGETVTHEYDLHNRLVKTVTPEFESTYSYNQYDELVKISSDNGTSKDMSYDEFGRLSSVKEVADNVWLSKEYTYANGNISKIKYTSHERELATENYVYTNGFLTEALINDTVPVYRLTKENPFGQATEVVTGDITRIYQYTDFGMPSGRLARTDDKIYQDFSYTFNAATRNLISRKDNVHGRTERFTYDDLDRLLDYSGQSVDYDIAGNITYKSDAGEYTYGIEDKPYAVSAIDPLGDGIPLRDQEIEYTAFSRPKSIREGRYAAEFGYNSEFDRVKMTLDRDSSRYMSRYYLGNCYEIDIHSTERREKLYLFGNAYNAPAVLLKSYVSLKPRPFKASDLGNRFPDSLIIQRPPSVNDSIFIPSHQIYNYNGVFNILRDYLGSITHIVSSWGDVYQELSYDAWGRLRDPETHKVFAADSIPTLILGRGYTGHEHLPEFGLVNMNARLYDPVLGRFLSPDPYIQSPDLFQNFNRYTYALNNPLVYVDEDGEFFWVAVGIAAVIGAAVNVATHVKEIQAAGGGWKSFWKGTQYFLTGAVAGGASAAVGLYAAAGFGYLTTYYAFGAVANGFVPGATVGFTAGATNGLLTGTSNSLIEGKNFGTALVDGLCSSATEGVIGGLTGGLVSGIHASLNGRNFFSGKYTTRTLVQRFGESANRNIPGKGHVAGTKKHKYAKEFGMRYRSRFGADNLFFEGENSIEYNGRILRADVVDRSKGIVFDYKFGYPNKTLMQLNNTRQMIDYREGYKMPTVIIRP